MLKSRDVVIGVMAATIFSSLAASQSQASLFDFLRPKKKAAHATARGQSPGWQPASTFTVSQSTYGDSSLPSGWGYDSSPCFNCGDCDHCIWCTKMNRRKCHQTWYPRLAPYCQAGWGWTQPCWRRMPDCYNCPRPEPISSHPRPLTPASAPAAPPAAQPLPALPEPPPAATSWSVPSRPGLASRQAAFAVSRRPVARQPVAEVQREATRYTSYADTFEPDEDDTDEMQAPDEEILESQPVAAEDDPDAGDDPAATDPGE